MSGKSSKISVGEALIAFLDNQYVSFDGVEEKFIEYAYTVFGHGCVAGSGEALSMGGYSLKTLQGKNEQGMALAATAYAKQNNRRKIIPCFSSIGPGAANMVTAAGTATANNIPLLLIAGDTFATRQPDPVLQQVEQPYDAGLTTNDAFKAVVRYFDRVSRPEMLMSALLNAMRVLTDPASTGAVALAMPQDVQGEIYEFPADFLKKRIWKIIRAIPSPEELADAATAIRTAEKPLIIVGGGVRYSEAGEAVVNFAEKYNIPFAETQAGKSAAPSGHKLNLGGIGVTGNSAANSIAAEADLIIGVGTRFTDFTTASKSLFAKARIVAVNASSYHGGKLDALKITADAKTAVTALAQSLDGYKSKYSDEIQKAKKNWETEMARITSVKVSKEYVSEIADMEEDSVSGFQKLYGTRIAQTAAIGIIRKSIADDAVIVGSAGSLPGCLQRMWTTDEKNSYNMEYGYSCMGYEIAGALGCKLAKPDKEVYAMVGDGSYLMLHSEMVTAVQERLKINILLFDNGGFGCINNLQLGQGIDGLATEFRFRQGDKPLRSGPYVPVDYAMSARAYGFTAYTVKTPDALRAALKASQSETAPVLIDIKVLPKSMTHGYGGWWNVGCTENPRNKGERVALETKKEMLKKARKY